MLAFGTIFLLSGVAAAVMLPDGGNMMQEKATEKSRFSILSLKEVFSVKAYRYLILILLLVGMAVSPLNNLKVTVLQSVGGTVSDLGIDAFICAITQVPFIALADRMERYPA